MQIVMQIIQNNNSNKCKDKRLSKKDKAKKIK